MGGRGGSGLSGRLRRVALTAIALGSQTFAAGAAAQARADCPAAIAEYDTVTGPYRLTLSPDVDAARTGWAECVDFVAASASADRGDFATAVQQFHDFSQANPASVLVGFAHDREERTYDVWARDLRRTDPAAAIPVYRDLIGEFGPDGHRTDLADTSVEPRASTTACPSATTTARPRWTP